MTCKRNTALHSIKKLNVLSTSVYIASEYLCLRYLYAYMYSHKLRIIKMISSTKYSTQMPILSFYKLFTHRKSLKYHSKDESNEHVFNQQKGSSLLISATTFSVPIILEYTFHSMDKGWQRLKKLRHSFHYMTLLHSAFLNIFTTMHISCPSP